ncbi:MAG: hypothetical protein ACN4GM_09235 [Gammaproteobacteria bacterium]
MSLSRETIRLMMQSQKMIQKEFGMRIQLDDEQMMARVFAYAAQSSSGDLKKCAHELMQQLIPNPSEAGNEQKDHNQSSAIRIYRGQVIAAESTADYSNTRESRSETKTRNNVIYRGRRVP